MLYVWMYVFVVHHIHSKTDMGHFVFHLSNILGVADA